MKIKGKQPTISVRLRPDATPTSITAGKFTRQQLDDLKPLYGPSYADIVRAATDALYVVLGNGTATTLDAQLDEMVEVYDLRVNRIADLALFWLWMQVCVGKKVFGQRAES